MWLHCRALAHGQPPLPSSAQPSGPQPQLPGAGTALARTARACQLALCGALALAGGLAAAQQPPSYEVIDRLESKPLGSRIRRDYVTGSSSLATYGRREILASGAASLGEFMQELPAQGSGANERHPASDGSQRADLHNFGAFSTLVLVNGRRVGHGGRGLDGAADLDSIPLAMVERVEVLRGGASAAYGSGAVAGVVNVVTRADAEGLHFRVRDSSYAEGGNASRSYELLYGLQLPAAGTSLVVGAQVHDRAQVLASQRPRAGRPPGRGLDATPQGSFQYGELAERGMLQDANGNLRRFLTSAPVTLIADASGNAPDRVEDDSEGDIEAVRLSSAGAFVELRFEEYTDSDGNTMYRTKRRYQAFELDSDDMATSTAKTYTSAEWEALTADQRGNLQRADGYRVEAQFSNDAWHADSSVFTERGDALPGNDRYMGTRYRLVSRAERPLFVPQTGDAATSQVDFGDTDTFGDPERWCSDGLVPKDGGGVAGARPSPGADPGFHMGGAGESNFGCRRAAADRYNPNGLDTVVVPAERSTVFATLRQRLGAAASVQLDAFFQDRSGRRQLGAPVLHWGLRPDERIDVANAYNPFDLQLCAAPDARVGGCAHADDRSGGGWVDRPVKTVWGTTSRVLQEFGPRVFAQDAEFAHLGASLDLRLGEKWQLDMHWITSGSSSVETQTGHLDRDRLLKALGPAADCTGDCVQLNLFGGQGADAARAAARDATGPGGTTWAGSGSITREMLDYVAFQARESGENSLSSLGLDVSGRFGRLQGGPIALTVGVEARSEEGFRRFQGDGELASPGVGSYDATSVFTEWVFPWISGADLSLESQFSLAVEDYSSSGTGYGGQEVAVGALTRIALGDSWIFRAGLSRDFRAPALGELLPGVDSVMRLGDPCDASYSGFTGDARTGEQDDDSRCDGGSAAGTRLGVADGYRAATNLVPVKRAASSDLRAETAKNLSVGMLFAPDRHLEFSFDYFETDLYDRIARIGAQQILDVCYGVRAAVAPDAFCQRIQRDGTTGALTSVADGYVNAGSMSATGYDIGVKWYDLHTSVGDFALTLDAYVTDTQDATTPLGQLYNLRGQVEGRQARNYASYRLDLALDWAYGPSWDARLRLRQMGASTGWRDLPPGSAEASSRQGLAAYVDGWLRYGWRAGLDREPSLALTLGFRNLFDQDPPYLAGAAYNNYDPAYRAWGSQTFYVALSGRF